MDENTAQPWDQLKDEKSAWFKRFEQYRLMGTKRSFLAVYNQERREKARKGATEFKPAKSVPSSWRNAAKKYRWEDRAEAWDAQEAIRIRTERAAEERRLREAAMQNRRGMLGAMENILARTMQDYMGGSSKTADPQDVMRLMTAMEKLNRDSRLEFGDMPKQEIDLNVKGSLKTGKITADDMARARAKAQSFEEALLDGSTSESDSDN